MRSERELAALMEVVERRDVVNYGFTREDVESLQSVAEFLRMMKATDGATTPESLRDLAARIEALLPPEDS